MQKRIDLTFFIYIAILAILFMVTMESSIHLYLTEEYDPNYYIYQTLLYALAGFVVIKNRKQIKVDGIMKLIWIFCLLCFFPSLVYSQTISIRSVAAIIFNTFIIPFAILNGNWLGNKLSQQKDHDFFLLLLQIPVLYSMFLLRSFNLEGYWFNADAAFVVIVFLPLIFFFKRNWLCVFFAFIYIVFSLTAAKRSILVFVAFCLVVYIFYLLFGFKEVRRNRFLIRLFLFIVISSGIFYIVSNENSGLMHTIERTESLGGMTDDNGRMEIYSTVSSAIFNSDFFSTLFGHGHMAVNSTFGMGAHNDILEIGYDYGIIATFLYVIIIFCYIFKTYTCVKHKYYKKAMRIGISVASIIILGMLNCIIESTILEYTMFLALGCALTLKDRLTIQ